MTCCKKFMLYLSRNAFEHDFTKKLNKFKEFVINLN